MGLRDTLKAKLKDALGMSPAAGKPNATRAPEPPAKAAPAPTPAKAEAPAPTKSAPAPTPAKAEAPAPAKAAPAPTPAKAEAPAPAKAAPTSTKATPSSTKAAPSSGKAASTATTPESGDDGPWTDVGPATAVRDGKAATWGLGEGVIAVFRHEGRLYCIDNACRHEDGPVGEGELSGCKVTCPYHDWQYDFTSGECLSAPGNRLATYAVKEEGGRIFVGRVLRPGTEARGGEHNDGMKVIQQ